MNLAYEKISYLWINYPIELENTNLSAEKEILKTEFESKRIFFSDHLVKIVVIGEISNGKSTLLNALFGRTLFSMTANHGTPSFFYCSRSQKPSEYFTIDDGNEIDDISILMDAIILRHNLDNFIDENTVIKVFIKDENIELLKRKTVIVDCPGLGHGSICDNEIKKHCKNADIFLFLFDVLKPATIKDKKLIKEICEDFRNPSCFFIYNKCDTIELDTEMMNNLRDEFYDTFEEQFVRNLRIGGEPFYLISAEKERNKLNNQSNNNDYNILCENEFERFKKDLLKQKNVSFIRLQNIISSLSKKLTKYLECFNDIIRSQMNAKVEVIDKKEICETRKNILKNKLTRIINQYPESKKNSKNQLNMEDIKKNAIDIIHNYIGNGDKNSARTIILRIADEFNNKISEKIQNNLKRWYDRLINEFEDDIILNQFNKNEFPLNSTYKLMPTDVDLNNFGRNESVDKTDKVKNVYLNYIRRNLNIIENSVNSQYDCEIDECQNNITTKINNMIDKEDVKINDYCKSISDKEKLIIEMNNYKVKCIQVFEEYKTLLI